MCVSGRTRSRHRWAQAAWGIGSRHSAANPAPTLFTQITDLPGLERQPSPSPDGRSLLYVGDARGKDDIYLLRIGGRKPLNLTEDSPVDDSAPTFST